MLLNTNEKGKPNLSENKNSLKHAGRYNPEKKSKELIQNIKKICEVREISYYTLARQADISTSTLHSLLSGKFRPYLYTVYKLCNALNISISELLLETENETMQAISKEEQELLRFYRDCSLAKRYFLNIYVRMLEAKALFGELFHVKFN